METDANSLVHQLNLPANNLPGAVVTHWNAWIRLFDFEVKYAPGRLNGGPNGLSLWPHGEAEPVPIVEDVSEETNHASFKGTGLECGPERKRGERGYGPLVGLRVVEKHNERQKEIGEILVNLKQLEGKTLTGMQRFRGEATQYLVAEGVFNWRRETNKQPAKLLVSTQQKMKPIEAAHQLSGRHGREGML